MCRPRVFATTMSVFARPVYLPGVFARPRVFATTRVFARPVFARCLHTPTCLRDDFARPVFGKCLRPTMCLRDNACLHPTCLCHFARPRVLATTRIFAQPVVAMCLRTPTCLRDDAGLRPTCLRKVSSHAHVSSRRRVLSPDLSSAIVFSRARMASLLEVPWQGQCAREVSSDPHVSSLSSPGMCLLTPRCLRRPCFEASVLDPTCLQNVSWVFGQYVHLPRRPQCHFRPIPYIKPYWAHIPYYVKPYWALLAKPARAYAILSSARLSWQLQVQRGAAQRQREPSAGEPQKAKLPKALNQETVLQSCRGSGYGSKVHIYLYLYIYICMYTCMYIYIYTVTKGCWKLWAHSPHSTLQSKLAASYSFVFMSS